jgi:hypothetical protein
MLRRGPGFAMTDLVGQGCASEVCGPSCFVLWITDAFSLWLGARQQIALLRVNAFNLAYSANIF